MIQLTKRTENLPTILMLLAMFIDALCTGKTADKSWISKRRWKFAADIRFQGRWLAFRMANSQPYGTYSATLNLFFELLFKFWDFVDEAGLLLRPVNYV